MGLRMILFSNIKKKTNFLLVILLCFLFCNYLPSSIEARIPIYNIPTLNNIGAPNQSIRDFIINGTSAYLYRGLEIEVMNISNLNEIRKLQSINITRDNYWELYSSHHIFDWNNNSIYNYYIHPYLGAIFVGALHYNETHLTDSYNITSYFPQINKTYLMETRYFQKDNIFYIIFAYINGTLNIEDLSIQICLLTLDISNRSHPTIISPPVLFYNNTGLEEWGETDRLVSERNRYTIYNDYLYLVRAYLSQEDEEHLHSGDFEFSYGFMKAWDISNPSNPIEVFTREIDRWDYSFNAIHEDLLFYNTNNYGFDLYNCSNLQDLQYLTSFKNNDNIKQIIISENLLYLISSGKVQILNIENPRKIKLLGQYISRFQGNGAFSKGILVDNILYLSRSSEYYDRCFYILDCSNPRNPKKLFPLGLKLSQNAFWDFSGYILFIGLPIIVTIIIITTTIILVRKRRKKKRNQT